MANETIVILDDERDVADTWALLLQADGYRCLTTTDPYEALHALETDRPDLLLTDLVMPGLDGMGVLEEAHKADPHLPVVMVTGQASLESAVAAIKAGAFDYVAKSASNAQLRLTIERALTKRRLELENVSTQEEPESSGFEKIIGRSIPLRGALELVRKAARSEANILILGESGTGKEAIARAVHANSPRADHPFVPIDCASLPENLLESELFGYEKGAFTGAATAKPGLMQAAHRGTLFLDELGELPLGLQAKLLRALQERQIRRVGGTGEIAIDVRIVSATNRDLRALVAAGKFREDLYYRVNVIDIALPPLRERIGDIELLANFFLRRYGVRRERSIEHFSPEAMLALQAYRWPGNVRELQNVIERACVLAEHDTVTLADLPMNLRSAETQGTEAPNPELAAKMTLKEAKERWIGQLEVSYLADLLEREGGNVSEVARKAGVDRKTVQRILNKHGIR